MPGSNIFRKNMKKVISLKLAVTMILSLFLFTLSTSDSSLVASAAPLPSDIIQISKISDIDTSNFLFVSEAEGRRNPMYPYVNTPHNDGRMWTDKTVNATQAFIYDTTGSVVDVIRPDAATPQEFLVTLSALSQTINSEDIIVEPTDTVFIIDVSGSMVNNNVPGSSPAQTRIQLTIRALNAAIKDLREAHPQNRIAVVVYGGRVVSSQNHARVQTILELDDYSDAPDNIFTVSGSNVTVAASVTPTPGNRTFTVEGGTPTQLGIRRAAEILITEPNKTATVYDSSDAPHEVIRRPNIVLMTDGEPTYAWTDYRLEGYKDYEGTTFTYDVGNGSSADMGLSALTVMTASYVKQLVRDAYYEDDTTRGIGFYTIGLGVNSNYANATLSPYGVSSSGVPNAQLVTQGTRVMLDVLNEFSRTTTPVTFPAINKGASTTNPPRTDRSVTNTAGLVKTCNYDTMAFTAMNIQDLLDAFDQITQQIVTQGNYTTNVTGDSEFDGYLAFSDVIGEYMQFESFKGLWYNDTRYSPVNVATFDPERTRFVNNFAEFQDETAVGPFLTSVNTMIDNDRLNGNLAEGKVVYYADASRRFMGAYNSPTPGALPLPRPTTLPDGTPSTAVAKVEMYIVTGTGTNSLTGVSTPLMDIVFQVVTALEPGLFETTVSTGGATLAPDLQRGDQIVRWYIPAALIPLRSVEMVDGSLIIAEAAPIRTVYSVSPNVTAIHGGLTAQYAAVNKAPGDNTYFFYTNRWRGLNGTVTAGDLGNMTISYFEPSEDNNYYYGLLRSREGRIKEPNATGPTGTAPFSWEASHFSKPVSGGGTSRVEVQRLGNNGRITLRADMELYIEKGFNFDAATAGLSVDDLSRITFIIIGRTNFMDPTTEIFRQAVTFDPNDSNFWTQTTPGPNPVYTSVAIPIPPIRAEYRVLEIGGFAANHVLTPPVPGAPQILPLITGDPFTFRMDNAYEEYLTTEELHLYKVFHGIFPDEIPADFELRVYGPESSFDGTDYAFDKTYVLSDLVTPLGASIMITETGLLPGVYFVTETNFSDPQYDFSVEVDGNEMPLPTFSFEISDDIESESITIIIDNIYDKIIYYHELTLNKIVQGLTGTDVAGSPLAPVGLIFKLERIDPEGYLQTIRYEDMTNGSYTFTDLLPGTYVITEFGGSGGDEFTGPRASASITIDGRPAGLVPYRPGDPPVTVPNSYVFSIFDGSNTEISFRYTNVYRPVPPEPPPLPPPPPETPVPPGPSPQTGVEPGSYFLAVIAISLGVVCIIGAELYRRTVSRKRTQKNGKE